jgi:hypothetical protein
MTPVIVRDEPGANPADLDSHRPHMMRLVKCRACERKHLVVVQRGIPFAERYGCVFCGLPMCEPTSTLALPVPMERGQSVYDALRAMGMRTLEPGEIP